MRTGIDVAVANRTREATSVVMRGFVAALMLVLGARATFAAADDVIPRQVDQEAAKQERIYGSQGPSIPTGYVFRRGLTHYIELLPSSFVGALRKLGPDHRWLDIGAGSAQAILDYSAPEPASIKARAVALSIEDRRSSEWYQRKTDLQTDRLRYLFGKRLREYSDEELGKFQMITDVYGGLSYTEELSAFMEKVLSILEVNGSFYSLLQSVRLEDGKDDPNTYYLTELVDSAGRDVKVCSWFKSITCVEASCESKSDWEAPTELIHVRKTCDAVSVPALLKLQYEAGTPPGRRFQLLPSSQPRTRQRPG